MTLVGVDLNSTRARAVHGPARGVPVPLTLEDGHVEMPLAVTLAGRHPEAGCAGAAICRKSPHLACLDFLPHLGGQRAWSAGNLRLDAARAFGVVCERLAPRFAKTQGAVLTLPPYLDAEQRAVLNQVAAKAKWRVLATAAAPVAAALAAFEQLPWAGLALVGDVDGHAFTWSAVAVRDDRATLLATHAVPGLGRAVWLRKLLDGVAHRCVRMTRRDPRESAEAEQSLYDQLAHRLAAQPEGSRVELVMRAAQWFQNLMLDAEELRSLCANLAAQVVSAMQDVLAVTDEPGSASAILLTDAAGRLPGLAALLDERLRGPAIVHRVEPESDFGEGLLLEESAGSALVHVLEPDALARTAHELAARVQRGDLPGGHHEQISLPTGTGHDDRGPACLHFRGRDHLLARSLFVLGRDPSCDLVFESELYPSVSARHCEIVLDRRVYLLRDRSRHGTLVNDCPVMQQTSLRAGDWIRLGPSGPLLRFLGQPGDAQPIVTTA